jgi:cysteinyl-tRNA synthetase
MAPTDGVLGGVILAGVIAFVLQYAINAATKRDITEITTQLERVKARYSKAVNISKAQADVEVEAYKQVWITMVDADAVLRDNLSFPRASPSVRELNQHRTALDSYSAMVDRWKPFYHATILDALDTVLDAMKKEYKTFEEQDEDVEGFRVRAHARAAVTSAIGDACATIRGRLAELTASGNPEAVPRSDPLTPAIPAP